MKLFKKIQKKKKQEKLNQAMDQQFFYKLKNETRNNK